MKHQVDKIFSNKLENHSIQPSDAVWAKVNKEVAKKKRGWYLPTGIAAGLALLLSIGLLLNNNEESVKDDTQSQQPIVNTEKGVVEPVVTTPAHIALEQEQVLNNDENTEVDKRRTKITRTKIAALSTKIIEVKTKAELKRVGFGTMPITPQTEEVIYLSLNSTRKELPTDNLKEKATNYLMVQYSNVKDGEDVEPPKITLPRIELKIDNIFAFNKREE